MKKSLQRSALLVVLTATQIPPPLAAAGTPRVRGRVLTESLVLDRLDDGSESVAILVRAKEHIGAHTASGDPIVDRRRRAESSTAAIRDILTPAPGVRLHSLPGARRVRFLWAANAVAAVVDRDTLDTLRSEPSVQAIYADRRVRWLSLPGPATRTPEVTDLVTAPTNYGLAKIGADRAQSERGLTGAGVRVGVIDTGVDASHPALSGKVIGFKDFIQGKEEAYDDQGHGTHCSGTIAGEGIGVAPGAKLIVAKALDQRGSGTLSGLLEAMQWMLDPDGDPSTDDRPHLVSNSWGANADSLGDGRSMFRDIVKAWRQAGIAPVFASGNSGPDTRAVPGGYPEAIAVGATDQQDRSASFSTGGPIEWDGETFLKPDISAPGVAIVSAKPGGGYQSMNGTSMACPHAAGAFALALEARPGTSVADLQGAFESGAADLGDSGRDARFGEGRIDVMATLDDLGATGATLAFLPTY